jgi:hypothetical protein
MGAVLNREEALQKLRAEISASGKGALLTPAVQERVLSTLALATIFRTASRMQQELKPGGGKSADPAAAWNRCMADLVLCSKFHCLYYMFRSFSSAVVAASTQGANPQPHLSYGKGRRD